MMSVELVGVVSLVEVFFKSFDDGRLAGALSADNIDISRFDIVCHFGVEESLPSGYQCASSVI
jgi:hypothetical protein